MKYFNDGEILLSDFDGVFLDSQKRFNEVMKEDSNSFPEFENYIVNSKFDPVQMIEGNNNNLNSVNEFSNNTRRNENLNGNINYSENNAELNYERKNYGEGQNNILQFPKLLLRNESLPCLIIVKNANFCHLTLRFVKIFHNNFLYSIKIRI